MAYPNSQSIISLAEYKALTGTTSTAYDTFLNAQIPSVERMVETYCRRRFLSYTWKEWFSADREILTSNWPISQVLLIGMPYVCFTIADTTNNHTFTVTNETPNNLNVVGKFSVVNSTTLVSTDYLFSNYTTVGALKTAVEAATTGVTFTYGTLPTTITMANVNTQTLRATNGQTVYFGANYFDQTGNSMLGDIWRIGCNSDRIFVNSNFVSRTAMNSQDAGHYGDWGNVDVTSNNYYNFNSYSPDDILVVYTAGYLPAAVPADLKQTIANIVRDIASIYDMDGSGIPRSIYAGEGLGDYNYRLDPNSSLGNLISIKYKDALDWYKSKNI